MAIIAPFSRYKQSNYRLAIIVLVIVAVWFAYDGYKNEKFIKKHTVDGVANSTLSFNRKAPPFMLAGAAAIGVYYWLRKKKKIVADDSEIVFGENEKIAYDAIQTVDKTKYRSKSFFVIGFKDASGKIANRKVSSKNYDNLDAVLDLLVSKLKNGQ